MKDNSDKADNICQECGKPLKMVNNLLHEKCWKKVLQERVFNH